MATKTFEELRKLAIQIRDEKANKQNTALRIGNFLLSSLDKMESMDIADIAEAVLQAETAADEAKRQADIVAQSGDIVEEAIKQGAAAEAAAAAANAAADKATNEGLFKTQQDLSEEEQGQVKRNLGIEDLMASLETQTIEGFSETVNATTSTKSVDNIIPPSIDFAIVDLGSTDGRELPTTPSMSVVLAKVTDDGRVKMQGYLKTSLEEYNIQVVSGSAEKYALNVNIITDTETTYKVFQIRYLSSSDGGKFKGSYGELSQLQAAYPTAGNGSYAFVGNPRHLYEWATNAWTDRGEFTTSVDQAIDPQSERAIANKAVSAKLTELDTKVGVKSEFNADLIKNESITKIYDNTNRVKGNLIVTVLGNLTDYTYLMVSVVKNDGSKIYEKVSLIDKYNEFRLDEYENSDYIEFVYVDPITEANKGNLHVEIEIGPLYTADNVTNKRLKDFQKDENSFNTKVFTSNLLANKVIRKLFIDTSEYTGGYSLEGFYIEIIARNVGTQWGILIKNSQKENIIGRWMYSEENTQSVTSDGIYLYAEFNWENMEVGQLPGAPFQLTNEVFNRANDPRNKVKEYNIESNAVTEDKIANSSVSTDKLQNNSVNVDKLDSNIVHSTTLTNGLYGQAGDSISEGAGLQDTLSESDPYNPIFGTKKATYGYYIAKLNRMRWANYGISGSTLGFVVANGQDRNGFSKEGGRYTQMSDDLTHLSIFFGWNDDYYGAIMKREEWLLSTYSTKIYYPTKPDLIGTNAPDGTPYTTQDQYEAVNAVTGEVGGKRYDNNVEYFNALYVGTENDSTNKTFWGAWNIVLPYLIEKYPLAKILIIVPYGTNPILRQCVRDAARKYGLTTYDFSNIENQLFFNWDDNKPNGMINEKTIYQFRIKTLTYDGVHPSDDGYKYLYPSINAKLLSL